MKTIIIGLLFLAGTAYAVTTNPASNATADSANTPLTIIYRDASGNFAAGQATFAGTVNSAQVGHASKTIAQLQVIVPGAKGDSYFCSDCSPAKLVVSTGTAAGNFADAVGGTFK